MKKKIILFLLIFLIAVLSFQFSWFQYILILCIIVSLLFLLVAGLVSIFKKLKPIFLKTPLIIIFIGILGILISFFRPYEEAIIHSQNHSENLAYAYHTDQSDRKELRAFIGYFSRLKERDDLRLDQVKKLYEKGYQLNPMDKFHAAFIFHHSDRSEDYKIAAELASEAANSEQLKNHYTVQWLHKAAYDRYMLSIGKPEKYHTQNKFSLEVK
tara:strand:- start:123 stop:761 length:639 start_codon:yes stop_codon:yes gene_type:complete